MTQLLTLTARAEVDCIDGNCGQVDRALVDPARMVLRHLAVERHNGGTGRLVPFEHVQSVGDHVRLDCSSAYYETFETADLPYQVSTIYRAAIGGPLERTVLEHNVPEGEIEVRSGEDVRADDGRLGYLREIVVDGDDGGIQQLIVTIGHLFGKHEVSVPASLVANLDGTAVQLAGTKDQVMKRIAA